MTNLEKRIENLVWDFDGVHWDYAQCPGTGALCNDIAASIALKVLPGLRYKEAIALSEKSYREHSNCIGEYTEWAKDRGLDHVAVRQEIYTRYHAALFNTLVTRHPQVFQPDQKRIHAFQANSKHINHALGTHSCVTELARPMLNRLGLKPFFHDAALVDLSNVDFVAKSQGVDLVKLALLRLKAAPEKSGFVEDTLANLERAKEIDSRLTTIYINNGNPLKRLPSYVDIQAENPTSLMRSIALAKGL